MLVAFLLPAAQRASTVHMVGAFCIAGQQLTLHFTKKEDDYMAKKKKTLEELLDAQTEAQTAVNNAQMKLNAIKTQVSEETERRRTNRLCTRGGHLEKYLEDPELFTNEEICKLIDCIFSLTPIRTLVGNMHKVRRGEAAGSVDELIETAAAKLKRTPGWTIPTVTSN